MLKLIQNSKCYESIKVSCYENVEGNKFAAILTNPPIRAGKKVVHEILEKAIDYLS